MNEPKRLRDVGSEDVRALLSYARPTRPITTVERERTAVRVLGKVAPLSVMLLFTAKGLAVGITASVAAVAASTVLPTVLTRHDPPVAQPAPKQMPSPHTAPQVPATADSARSVPVPVPPQKNSVEARPAPIVETPEPEKDKLAREAELIERARAALKSSPARALALAEQHARTFPTGYLSLERELVAVDALQRLHRRQAARARGEALLSRARGSIYEDRIRRLLEKVP